MGEEKNQKPGVFAALWYYLKAGARIIRDGNRMMWSEVGEAVRNRHLQTGSSGQERRTPHEVTHSGPQETIPLPNYFAIIAIGPAFLSIVAYEALGYLITKLYPGYRFSPIAGLGMLIPMALLMELFTYFLAKYLSRRINTIQRAMRDVAAGDYGVRLDVQELQPFSSIADSFNTMTTELSSVETLRNDFINDFSHEFKTPITSINGFAKLLLEEDVDDEDSAEYLKIIAEESARLADLATNTLMMNKLDSWQTIPNKAPYALDEQVRRDVLLLQTQWSAKKIDMDVELEPVTYMGNADLMSHIWINILNNAIKFTPEGGKIAVRLVVREGSAVVSVRDNGPGMSQEQAKRIFQKYYQADRSHATKGIGLGLAIARRIAELAGGGIRVTSLEGSGSTFTATLPLEKS